MLKLAPGQMSAFERAEGARFYADLGADLDAFMARELPDFPEENRPRHISHVFFLCQHYRIETRKDITQLSYILVTFPPNFYEYPEYAWVHSILISDTPASQRIARLTDALLGT